MALCKCVIILDILTPHTRREDPPLCTITTTSTITAATTLLAASAAKLAQKSKISAKNPWSYMHTICVSSPLFSQLTQMQAKFFDSLVCISHHFTITIVFNNL